MNLIRIVHEIRVAKGTNAKLRILKRHSDNSLWKQFLAATYDQRISYGVSSPKTFDFDNTNIDEFMFNTLNELANRKITGNQAKFLVKRLSEQFGEIPRLILNRSIKAGISSTTINKAYPGLITIFKTMKGKDVTITEYPVMSSIKFDGVKVFSIVTPTEVKLLTSSGAEFKCTSLQSDMSQAGLGVYEGELIYKEGRQVDRAVITGKLNSLLAGTKTDISDYSYQIYDYITHSEWGSKIGKLSFAERQEILESIFETAIQDSWHVKKVEHLSIHNEDQLINWFNELIKSGFEGLMCRYSNDVYMWTGDKRTDRLIKKKSIRECVLTCVSVTPHTNPLKGNIGSLFCSGTISDKLAGTVHIEVNVGSGLSKMDRQYSEDRYIGEKIEITYNSVTDTDTGYSLFLPRYKRILGQV